MDDEEYLEIQNVARRQRMTVDEWIIDALRKAKDDRARTVEAKLRAIAQASCNQFPTSDIDVMLQEIESGQGMRI